VSVLVIDASVVIKWFVPEVHSDAARHLLARSHDFVAPDLLFAEAANTIWKKTQRRELTSQAARRLVADLGRIAVDTVPSPTLIEDAHALAIGTRCTVYDALYVALAARLNTSLVTADQRLVAALCAFPLVAAHVQFVAESEA
jgi:predicted nucleic acid-binding protein